MARLILDTNALIQLDHGQHLRHFVSEIRQRRDAGYGKAV